MTPGIRDVQVKIFQDFIEVLAPSNGHRGCANRILKHQVPADDPGNKFTHGGIGIGVGAAGDGNHGSKFRIAESGEGATKRSNDEGDGDGGSRGITRGGGRADE